MDATLLNVSRSRSRSPRPTRALETRREALRPVLSTMDQAEALFSLDELASPCGGELHVCLYVLQAVASGDLSATPWAVEYLDNFKDFLAFHATLQAHGCVHCVHAPSSQRYQTVLTSPLLRGRVADVYSRFICSDLEPSVGTRVETVMDPEDL